MLRDGFVEMSADEVEAIGKLLQRRGHEDRDRTLTARPSAPPVPMWKAGQDLIREARRLRRLALHPAPPARLN